VSSFSGTMKQTLHIVHNVPFMNNHSLVSFIVLECYCRPQCNEPIYNEVSHITNWICTPVRVKCRKQNPDMTSPRYDEHILAVPWHFVISGSTAYFFEKKKGFDLLSWIVYLFHEPQFPWTSILGQDWWLEVFQFFPRLMNNWERKWAINLR